jgi:hypothetical protein
VSSELVVAVTAATAAAGGGIGRRAVFHESQKDARLPVLSLIEILLNIFQNDLD